MLTREDQEIRRGRITSSTAAACLGLDPFCTPMRAWLRITGREDATFADDASDGDAGDAEPHADATSRGHWIEPSLIAYGAHWLVKDTRGTVTIERPSTVSHPDLPWLADSMDALYRIQPRDGSPAVLVGGEAKDVAHPHAHRWGEAPDGIVPEYVQIQCAIHAMHYPEIQCMLVPTLIGSMHTLACYVLDRNRDLEYALLETLGRWHHEHVVGDEPPPAVSRDAKLLNRVWQGASGAMEDDPIVGAWAMRDVELREQIKALEAQRDAVQTDLKSRLRDYTECRGAWGSVTWRRGKSRVKVDHETAFGKLRARVSEALSVLGTGHFLSDDDRAITVDDVAEEILRECTSERPGNRPLLTRAAKPKGDD